MPAYNYLKDGLALKFTLHLLFSLSCSLLLKVRGDLSLRLVFYRKELSVSFQLCEQCCVDQVSRCDVHDLSVLKTYGCSTEFNMLHVHPTTVCWLTSSLAEVFFSRNLNWKFTNRLYKVKCRCYLGHVSHIQILTQGIPTFTCDP
jgi:hypothetical protein